MTFYINFDVLKTRNIYWFIFVYDHVSQHLSIIENKVSFKSCLKLHSKAYCKYLKICNGYLACLLLKGYR